MPHYTAYYYASDLKALYAASVNPEKKVSNHTYGVKVEPQRMLATNGGQAMMIKPLRTDEEAEGRKLTKGDRLRMISGIEETKQYVDEFRKWQFNLGRV